jgi:hypothetical protein
MVTCNSEVSSSRLANLAGALHLVLTYIKALWWLKGKGLRIPCLVRAGESSLGSRRAAGRAAMSQILSEYGNMLILHKLIPLIAYHVQYSVPLCFLCCISALHNPHCSGRRCFDRSQITLKSNVFHTHLNINYHHNPRSMTGPLPT